MKKPTLATLQRHDVLAAVGVRGKDCSMLCTDMNVHSNKVKMAVWARSRWAGSAAEAAQNDIDAAVRCAALVEEVRDNLMHRDDVISVTADKFWGAVVVHFAIPEAEAQLRKTKAKAKRLAKRLASAQK